MVNKAQWEYIESEYFLTTHPIQPAEYSVHGTQLLRQERAEAFVEWYASRLKACVPEVACTFFMAWCGRLCSAAQYLLAVGNVALNLHLSNVTVQMYEHQEGYECFTFVLDDATSVLAPAGTEQCQAVRTWKQQVLTELYGETVRPLVESLATAVGTKPKHLWSNLATTLYYMHDVTLKKAAEKEEEAEKEGADEELSERIQEDFRLLTRELPGQVFGLKKNPFDITFRMIPGWKNPEQQIRQKARCCLYYQTEGGTYCYTCPRLTETEREQRRKELLARNT